MGRLTRYVARTYAGAVGLTLALLVSLVVAVTLVENAGQLARGSEGAGIGAALALAAAAEYSYLTLPVACFLGALVAGQLLARRGELLAMQAAGCGRRSAWAPFVGVGCLFACAAALAGEWWVPRGVAARVRLAEELRRSDALNQFYTHRAQWYREGPWVLYLPRLDTLGQRFVQPTVYRLQDGLMAEAIDAAALRFDGMGWYLQDAVRHAVASPDVRREARLPLGLHIAPGDLMDVAGNPRAMPTAAMARLIERRAHAGFDTTPHRVELYGRVAHPVSALCLLLVAMPWATDPDRRRSLAAALGAGVALVALHLCLSQVFRLLALAHKASPGVGAWAVPAMCLALVPVSVALAARYRRRGGVW